MTRRYFLHYRIPPSAILEDMRRVAKRHGGRLSQCVYSQEGRWSSTPAERRWGSWNRALTAAGLLIVRRRGWAERERRARKALRHNPKTAKRDCLRCEHPFQSHGPHNRLCDRCRVAIDRGDLLEDVA